MSTIVTRAGKGSALTHNEVDANFNNLNNDKIEAAQSVTLTNKTISGSNNTLSNIGNSSLTNSSVTLGSTSVSLGSTVTSVSGLSLTGGAINNATIGASTATTGAFTTLSASSTVSGTGFSTYLASPPAIGGTAAAAGSFTTLSATGVTTVQAGTVSAPAITTSGDTNTGIFFPAADTIAFTEGGVESMRIDSAGNVGIGTSSPLQRFTAANASISGGGPASSGSAADPNAVSRFQAGSVVMDFGVYSAGQMWIQNRLVSNYATNYDLVLQPNGGNLGLGVTPSAWFSTYKAIQLGAYTALAQSGGSNTFLLNNAFVNAAGTTTYLNTAAASYYNQSAGVHSWFTAPSGTAGNAITFTQAMTLDASGNLGIGNTTPHAQLNTYTLQGGSTIAVTHGTGGTYPKVSGISFGSTSTSISPSNNGGTTTFVGGAGIYANNTAASNNPTDLVFWTTSGGVSAERARIDASGFTQFSSNLVMPYQGAPTSKSTTATLTGAELITGILNTTGTSYTVTLPTGTNIEGALTWSANNVCLDFFVINTASGTITIGANGNTTLGSLTIATGTSAQFRIRRTAANTFTVYRLG